MRYRRRPAFALAALGSLTLLSHAPAQSNWVDFSDETGNRLVLTTVPLTDGEEKDVTVGDFDQDGDTDLVIGRKKPFSEVGKRPNVLLMNENGVLTERTSTLIPAFLIPSDTRDVLAFDADGDGWLDLVTANTFQDPPRLFINQGRDQNGVFLGWVESLNWFSPAFSPGPKFCAVYDGDVDNDGDLDLYFSDYNNTLEDRLLINDGSGVFVDETATRFPTGINDSVFGTGSFICDFNLDGWNDIVKASGMFEPLKLLINDQTGHFTQAQTLPSTTVYMVRTADFNNDGRRDLYVVSDDQDYELINNFTNANGTINVTRVNVTGSSKTANFGGNVKVTDLDRDGWLDVGVADVDVDIPGCTRRFAALRNRKPSADSFSDPNNQVNRPWNTRGNHDIAWIDIDGDGFMDLFQARCSGYGVFMMVPFAVAEPYGSGCSGTNGIPEIGASEAPSIPSPNFQITLDKARPLVRPILFGSFASAELTLAGGCDLLVSAPLFALANVPQTDANGSLVMSIPIPNNANLEGARVFLQFAVPDPNGQFPGSGGAAFSDGLELYISQNEL